MSSLSNTEVSSFAASAVIAVDEHTSVACMIDDTTLTGLKLTLLDAAEVPNTFVLLLGATMRVCSIVHRTDEEIEARFADIASVDRMSKLSVRTNRLDTARQQRRAVVRQDLKRAA